MSDVPILLAFVIRDARGSASRARRIVTSLLLLLLVFTATEGCAAEHGLLDSEKVVTLVREYIRATSKSDFIGAAKLFEYPPSYSARELNEDLAAVARDISFAQAETGTVRLTNGVNDGVFMIVGFGGGNIKYWHQGPKSISFTYRALFVDGMEGQLSFDVVATSAGYRFRQVKYGFPSIAAGAVRAKSLYAKINQRP
jgi:hypothetical protein